MVMYGLLPGFALDAFLVRYYNPLTEQAARAVMVPIGTTCVETC